MSFINQLQIGVIRPSVQFKKNKTQKHVLLQENNPLSGGNSNTVLWIVHHGVFSFNSMRHCAFLLTSEITGDVKYRQIEE